MVRRDGTRDPFHAEIIRRANARVPAGFALFIGCLAVATLFEVARFPERRPWMLGFAGGFLVLLAISHLVIRARPAWTIPVMLVFVNAAGVGLNAYHVLVGGSVAMCLWTLTGLLCSAAVIIPWGPWNQALASLGALATFPLHLEVGGADVLSWGAGATYLLLVVGMSIFGSGLFASYLRHDLQLAGALTERETRLQSYFDLALIGTAILLPSGRCSEVNDELCRVLGYHRHELLRLGWTELAHPDERAAARRLVRRALWSSGPVGPHDARLVRRDGSIIQAAVILRGLPGPDGVPDHVMALVQDVTEHRREDAAREQRLAHEAAARAEAEAANRAKDAFLATVSHELRTPLSPILAWSGLLRRGSLRGDDAERALAAIERNAGAQARLIEDLLDVSRMASGRLVLEQEPVELTAVVRAAADVVRPEAEAKGLLLETNLGQPAWVSGESERLQQIFWNLLANAVKFTPPGGRIVVQAVTRGDTVEVTVHDTGQGISPAFLPHVFERFRQEESTRTRMHGGLGLGLAIVHDLVELHGGRIAAASPGEGHGATFTVTLPCRAAPAIGEAPPTPVRTDRDDEPLDGLRVLVVDDDPDSNEVVRQLLDARGADVRTASSVPTALAVLSSWQADVVVSDIAMPGEDGYSLLTQLRERPGPPPPAIALTAYAGVEDRQQALRAGFRAHVTKPLRTGELLAAVEDAARATGRLAS